jgi:tRNA pseudouridine32 synthase/23S rRNA pseudouridine746 synthase
MIIGDMSKSRNGSWHLSRTVNNPAITQFFSSGMGNGLRLYIVKIHTGKTHQIRVALKSLGVPILGDSLYNKKKDNDFIPDRGYLHAFAIRFKLGNKEYRFLDFPSKGVHFLTDNFNNSFVKYKNPWLLQWRTKNPVRCDMLKG